MAGHGTPKGIKFGGRKKGTRNKQTLDRLAAEAIEKQILTEVSKRVGDANKAAAAVERAKANRQKLAKDVLEEFMNVFAGLAAVAQPLPEGVKAPPGRKPNPAEFEKWARLAVQVAKDLAPFQSPTFKAIQVMAPAPVEPVPAKRADNVVQIDDPQALARVYQKRITAVGGR